MAVQAKKTNANKNKAKVSAEHQAAKEAQRAANKKKQGLAKKIGITIVCVVLALAMTIPSLALLFTPQDTPANTASSAAGAATTMADIDAQYTQTTSVLEEQYASASADKSKNENTQNETLGNVYFDWAKEARAIATTDEELSHVDELWAKAISYYDKYLVNGESTGVEVDRAIATFYKGDTQDAIDLLETFTAKTQDYSPAWANLGFFYESSGDTDKAKAAYNKALEVDPTDKNAVASFVNSHLDSLE